MNHFGNESHGFGVSFKRASVCSKELAMSVVLLTIFAASGRGRDRLWKGRYHGASSAWRTKK